MADQGRARKEVILDLVKNIQQFKAIVTNEIGEIKRDANNLSSCWNDPQYMEFLKFTLEITEQLQKDVTELGVVDHNLKIKADKF